MKPIYSDGEIKQRAEIMNEYDKTIIVNGCSPSWLTKSLPKWLEKRTRVFRNLIFVLCCNTHDLGFYLGGNKKDFKLRNSNFKKCNYGKTSCLENGYSWLFYRWESWKYFKLVSWFGKSSFYWTKERKRELPSFVRKPRKLEKIEEEFNVKFKINLSSEYWFLSPEDSKKVGASPRFFIVKPAEILKYEKKNNVKFELDYFITISKIDAYFENPAYIRWVII